MKSNIFLVIGGDGQLGSSLITYLTQMGKYAHSTHFLNVQNSVASSFLNLSEDISNWQIPKPIDAVFFCAAITSIDQCRAKPIESRKINVENTLALSKRLAQTGAAIFFPSSNLVFDGLVPLRKANDPISPCCEYGRQKAEAEHGLLDLTEKISIVRFTKIVGPSMLLIQNWIKDLRQGKTIHPFSDMVLSPISIQFATKVAIAIMERESYGIWQVSAKEDVTYEQIARYLAHKMGISQKLIKPITVDQSELRIETLPKHTTLDTTRLKVELGIEAPRAWDALDEVLQGSSSDVVAYER